MPIHLRSIFFAGSRFDHITGTAHFLEHMLTAGTEKFPTKNLIADYVQRIGADFAANTDVNVMRLILEIPEAQDLTAGINVLSQALTASLISDKAVETERGAIISELNSKKSNPKEYIWELSRSLTLAGLSVGRSIIGTEAEVRSIGKEDILKCKDLFINANRLCFVASGDVEIQQLVDELDKIQLPSGQSFTSTEKLPVNRGESIAIENYPGAKQLHVALTTRTNIEDYKEYCALRVLQNILALGRGSRLVTKLRYENGLVYSVSGGIQRGPDFGIFRIVFACDKENFQRVMELIYDEFASLIGSGITADELERVKLKTAKGQLRQMQTSESWVDFHEVECVFSPQELHSVEDYIEAIQAVEIEDVQKVIHKYLNKDQFYTAVCGDYQI